MAVSGSACTFEEFALSECRSELLEIRETLGNVVRLLQESNSSHASLSARVSDLEGKSRGQGRQGRSELRDWVCPVCQEPFAHRESFKGHIRSLTLTKSERSHCAFDSHNQNHQALLSHPRYGDGDFFTRASAFAHQLYDTVKSHSSSARSSQSSHSAVRKSSLFVYIRDFTI